MTQVMQDTIETLSKLPLEKVSEVADFAEFILKKHEEEVLQNGIQQLVSGSETFAFLKDDDDLYSIEDLKVKLKRRKAK